MKIYIQMGKINLFQNWLQLTSLIVFFPNICIILLSPGCIGCSLKANDCIQMVKVALRLRKSITPINPPFWNSLNSALWSFSCLTFNVCPFKSVKKEARSGPQKSRPRVSLYTFLIFKFRHICQVWGELWTTTNTKVLKIETSKFESIFIIMYPV